jgi:hypothetical protein
LNLNYTVSVSPKNPRSLAKYNNEIYVGTTSGSVLVVANKIVIRSFTACSSDFISSMVFDNFGLMAIACRDEYRVKLFHSNGTDTTKIFSYSVEVYDVQFESKGHFVVSLKNWTSYIFVFF